MALIASIEGNLFYFVAAAIYGVIMWFKDRQEKKAAAEELARRAEQRPKQSANRPTQTKESADQERMRKFLEALGVPSSAQPAPPTYPAPTQRPQQLPQRPDRQASPTLAPRPVAMPIPRPSQTTAKAPPKTAPSSAPKPPTQPSRRVIEPVPVASMDPGRLEEPAAKIEGVSAEFTQMHGHYMAEAAPSIRVAAAGNAPTTSVLTDAASPQGRILRELLRKPESLRAAIVISEVLGPPKGA